MFGPHPSPRPTPQPEPEIPSTTVVTEGGARYVDCGTLEGIDAHIVALSKLIAEHAAFPKRVAQHRLDQDALMDARETLALELMLNRA
jgi:hypothetical protein